MRKQLLLCLLMLTIGFTGGIFFLGEELNLDGIQEASKLSAHTNFLRGCVAASKERGVSHWQWCVEEAKKAAQDHEDIMKQEPQSSLDTKESEFSEPGLDLRHLQRLPPGVV